MEAPKHVRLGQVARKLNVGIETIVAYLADKGFEVASSPNVKLSMQQYELLNEAFIDTAAEKRQASSLEFSSKPAGQSALSADSSSSGHAVMQPMATSKAHARPSGSDEIQGQKTGGAKHTKVGMGNPSNVLRSLKVVGTIRAFSMQSGRNTYSRAKKSKTYASGRTTSRVKSPEKTFTKRQIQEKIKSTLAKLHTASDTGRSKQRKEERAVSSNIKKSQLQEELQKRPVLRVTKCIAAKNLATMMDVSVDDFLAQCVRLGIMVSINQALDEEAVTVLADEFGYEVVFVDEQDREDLEGPDDPEKLRERAPVVVVMGHVDHGKTALLNCVRQLKTPKKEVGGITQHIGAFEVVVADGDRIVFLDTPGHEAFTAMRARGARVADLAILVIAADDGVMPQTKEAISHAQLAGVPIVVAINKMDKPQANAEKVREGLSRVNILVEEWGGKYRCQEISTKTGQGIDELLEKVLLTVEELDLKANPDKKATGSVLEAELTRGKGYVTTVMVQAGTLHKGDIMLVGEHYGRLKSIVNCKGELVQQAGPSTPVQVLGLDHAPQAGQKFHVVDTESEANKLATRRRSVLREQNLRTKQMGTKGNIIERIGLKGSLREFNFILKGDVDGSIEALADALLKLSTAEIKINIIYKAVGPITESDVLLAAASSADIIGFHVNSTSKARNLASEEHVKMRLYRVIYDVVDDVKKTMKSALGDDVEEVVTGRAEVRKTFQIARVGTVAGCYVTQGTLKASGYVRFIRDGVTLYQGAIKRLKRERDTIKEAQAGSECGISVDGFNDIQVKDVVEGYEERVK